MEAVDSGVLEITRWLDDAEALLGSFSLHGTKETIQRQLDQHKVEKKIERKVKNNFVPLISSP